MLEKRNYMHHIIFLTNIAFNVTALCTTSELQFLLSCQMKQERYNVPNPWCCRPPASNIVGAFNHKL